MDPRIQRLEVHLESRRAELARALGAAPVDTRALSPGMDRWSVDRVMEHLAQTEQGITRLVTGLVAGASVRDDAEPFDEDAFTGQIAMSWALDRGRPVRGRQPAGELDAQSAWSALQQSRAVLLDVVRGAAGRRLEDVKQPHPAGHELNGYQWIAFVGSHEARHAAQIDEIVRELRSR